MRTRGARHMISVTTATGLMSVLHEKGGCEAELALLDETHGVQTAQLHSTACAVYSRQGQLHRKRDAEGPAKGGSEGCEPEPSTPDRDVRHTAAKASWQLARGVLFPQGTGHSLGHFARMWGQW